jgi:predicted O-methyltransferase YrrM
MNWRTLVDGARGVNLATLQLFLARREETAAYVSACVQLCDSLLRKGLVSVDPLHDLRARRGSAASPQTCALPVDLHDGGGTRLEELIYLAAVTRLLNPRKIFEIGTFKGRTTTVFALNAPEAEIVTLDLPPDYAPGRDAYIETDAELVRLRNPVEFIERYGVSPRCRQILCDSKFFDPEPHAGSVDLAFIDGAHTDEYVRNDTEKIARMMRADGLVFWHDYGGKGRFRGITDYLHELAERFPVYRVPGTTLAWAPAAGVCSLVTAPTAAQADAGHSVAGPAIAWKPSRG